MRNIVALFKKLNERGWLLFTLLFTLVAQPLFAQVTVTKEWDKRFGGTANDDLNAMVATSDGGFLLGGFSLSGADGDKTEGGRGGADFWVVKIDAAGTKLWDKRFGGSGEDRLYSVVATSDGGYLLGGFSDSGAEGDKTENSRGLADYWVVKINAAGTKVWDRRFGGNDSEYLYSIVATQDGGFLLGGISLSGEDGDKTEPSRGQFDYWVVKINATGAKVWDKRFGGNNTDDYLRSIVASADGGFLLGGYTSSGTGGDKTEASRGVMDYWVIKIDAAGAKVWDRRFGGTGNEQLRYLVSTSDGGFLLGGYSNSGEGGDKTEGSMGQSDYWVVKIDAAGTKIWDRRFGGNDNDQLFSMAPAGNGGFFLGGYSMSGLTGDKTENSRGGNDYWVLKIDAAGTKVWDKRFGGTGNDVLQSLVPAVNGGLLLGGLSFSGDGGDRTESTRGGDDYWVVKIKEGLATGLSESVLSKNLQIYPNPTSGSLHISFPLPGKSDVHLILFDAQGKEVKQEYYHHKTAAFNHALDLSNVAAGVYLLQLITEDGMAIRRIVKQ